MQDKSENYFPVWLRNRLMSAGLEQFLGHTETSYIVLLSANQIKIGQGYHTTDRQTEGHELL